MSPRRWPPVTCALLAATLACRAAPSPPRAAPPAPPNVPPALREAVRAANADDPSAGSLSRWQVVAHLEHAGLVFEHYRLGSGPHLVLLPAPGPATTVQVWLPLGWGNEAPGRPGRIRRWAAGWPTAPLGPRVPVEHWHGTARDLAGASWTVAREDAEALIGAVSSRWPTRTSTPALAPVPRLEGRLRRAFWDTVVSAPRSDAPPDEDPVHPDRAVWVIAGPHHRARTLTLARRALARPPRPPRPPIERRRPGPGPRIPVEVSTPAEVQVALLGWTWADPTPDVVPRLEALAYLLGEGPQPRLQPLFDEEIVRGITLGVEAGPAGASLEAFVNLGPSGTATVAAARAREALRTIGAGLTTGLELEHLRSRLEAERQGGWSSLWTRAARAAEALIVFGDLASLEDRDQAVRALREPALRVLARTLAQRPPVVVEGRAP